MIDEPIEFSCTVNDMFDQKRAQFCTLKLKLEPIKGKKEFKKVY